jgi:hypothetical protein
MEDHSSCVLATDAADRYIDRVSALVRAAHLNSFFCAPERLLRNLSALHSRVHGGLQSRLLVVPSAGLPAPSEWVRVREEGRVAEPVEALKVELRHHEPDPEVLHVRVIVDTVETTGLIVRFTIEMTETAKSVDSQQLLIRNGEDLFVSPELRNRLSMLSSASAESAFLELAVHPGVAVQRVIRGTIGPFCVADLPSVLPFGPLLTDPRGAFASFALDTASRDIVRDGNNDPLSHRLLDPLAIDSESLTESERSRLRLGYHVYRDRKFVTDHATQVAIEELCRSAGTRNVIYLAAINNSTSGEYAGLNGALLPGPGRPHVGAGVIA